MITSNILKASENMTTECGCNNFRLNKDVSNFFRVKGAMTKRSTSVNSKCR